MEKKEMAAALEHIIELAQAALNSETRGQKAAKGATSMRQSQTRRLSLPSHILALRDSGFFKTPRTSIETHEKLQASYPCDLDKVKVALIRLQRRHELRKTEKKIGGKVFIAYVQ